MKTIILTNIERIYTNNGQHLEQVFRYNLTGNIEKADNIAHDKGTDIGNYSVKSARATVCKGTDIDTYLDTDKATEFVYITKNLIAYIMTKALYREFITLFATKTTESVKNGGGVKLRLKSESKIMLEWLRERA